MAKSGGVRPQATSASTTGTKAGGLGLVTCGMSMTLGGLLADGADGRTETKQGYN